MGEEVTRPRSTRWPPPRPFRRAAAVATPTQVGRVKPPCPQCHAPLDYEPNPRFRDLDIVRCPCGFQTLVDFSGALDRRAEAVAPIAEAAMKEGAS